MKKQAIPLLVLIVAAIFYLLVFNDPNKKAKELFVEACNYYQQINSAKSHTAAFDLCNKIQGNIENILSRYPSSDIAVAISSDQIKITNITLQQFKAMVDSIRQLAEAENEPLACAYLLAILDENSGKKVSNLMTIADNYTAVGQNAKAIKVLSQIMTNENITDPQDLLKIADKYIIAGDCDSAVKLLTQLKTAAYKLENDDFKLQQSIAIGYAKADRFDLAFNTIRYARGQRCLCGVMTSLFDANKTNSKAAAFIPEMLNIIHDLRYDFSCDLCQNSVACYLAEQGQVDLALKEIEFIADPQKKITTILEVVRTCLDLKNPAQATKVYNMVFEPLNKIDATATATVNLEIRHVRELLENKTIPDSLPSYSLLYEKDGVNGSGRACILTESAMLFFRSGHKAEAKSFFQEAQRIFKAPSDDKLDLAECAEYISEIALEADNLELFNLVMGVFDSVPPSHWKDTSTPDLAMKYVYFGQKEKACAMLNESISGLELFENEFIIYEGGAEAWEDVCVGGAKLGLISACSQKMLSALESIGNNFVPTNPNRGCLELAVLAKIYAKSGIPFGSQEKTILCKIVNSIKPFKPL